MSSEYSRGRETTHALTEVRTVLSRAETALDALDREAARDGGVENRWSCGAMHPQIFHADRDIEHMREALQNTVRELDRYRRTGKTK